MIRKFRRTRYANFNGTTSLVAVTDAAEIQDIFDGGGTLEMWLNTNSGGAATKSFWGKRSTTYLFAHGEVGGLYQISFVMDFDTTDGVWRTAVNLPVSQWTHFALAYDADDTANNPIVYINGVARTVGSGLTEAATPAGTRVSDATVGMRIGKRPSVETYFDGQISDVRLWDDIRTADEIADNYRKRLAGDEAGLVWYSEMNAGLGTTFVDKVNGNDGVGTDVTWRNRIVASGPRRFQGIYKKPFIPINA